MDKQDERDGMGWMMGSGPIPSKTTLWLWMNVSLPSPYAIGCTLPPALTLNRHSTAHQSKSFSSCLSMQIPGHCKWVRMSCATGSHRQECLRYQDAFQT